MGKHKNRQKKMKKYQIIGIRQVYKPYKKVVQKILEVEQRDSESAEKLGMNYAKMMGCEFSHVIEVTKS